METTQNRRKFLRTVAASGAVALSVLVLPGNILGGPEGSTASEKINLAGIGLGGRGFGLPGSIARNHNVVALCVVDDRTAAPSIVYPALIPLCR